jgi:hypothetical protein
MKKRHEFEEQGAKNLAGMRQQCLYYFFLSPDEKATRVRRAGAEKLGRNAETVSYYFLLPDEKAERLEEQMTGKPCRDAAKVSCTIFFITR